MRGRLISPKTWNRSVEIFGEFLGHFWSVRISLGTDLGICIIIYIINCVLVYKPLEIKL